MAFLTMSGTCNDDGDFSLKKGESNTLKINGIKYTITLTDINDNRCPKNVKCIRAGEAFAHATFKPQSSGERLMQFCTGLDCRRGAVEDADTVATSSGSIEIKLLSVDPFPGQGASDTSKTAKFAVRKL